MRQAVQDVRWVGGGVWIELGCVGVADGVGADTVLPCCTAILHRRYYLRDSAGEPSGLHSELLEVALGR